MARWIFNFRSKSYEFDPDRDLSLYNLRHIKAIYPELASYKKFIDAMGEGDPDAIACLIWIARKRSGEQNVIEPNRMEDFSLGDDFYTSFEFLPDAPPEESIDPLSPSVVGDKTRSSTRTRTSSSGETSE